MSTRTTEGCFRAVEEIRDVLASSLLRPADSYLAAVIQREAVNPAVEELVDLLTEALPYVEEGEAFNKPQCRTLSKRIRATLEAAAKGTP